MMLSFKMPMLTKAVLVVALVMLAVGLIKAPVSAQTPTVTPNSPYQAGLNAIVVTGGGAPAVVTSVIEGESGLTVSALWLFSGGAWQFYVPVAPAASTLTVFQSSASAFAVLAAGGGSGFSLAEVNRLNQTAPSQRRIVDIRVAQQAGFDRVVWEFAQGLPPYRVGYVNKPVLQCASGLPVVLGGSAALAVRFDQIMLFDGGGNNLVPPANVPSALSALVDMKQTCGFEGQAAWALGTSSMLPFRVIELSNPPRIVVDIQHPGPVAPSNVQMFGAGVEFIGGGNPPVGQPERGRVALEWTDTAGETGYRVYLRDCNGQLHALGDLPANETAFGPVNILGFCRPAQIGVAALSGAGESPVIWATPRP